jgi:hypothetical protein
MRTLRTVVAWLVISGVSTSAFAGDLAASVARAARQEAQSSDKPMPKGYLWGGTALFVGGMTVGIYAFLHNRNGQYPGLNEATATNKPLGAAGLATAFVGGTILFLGERKSKQAASVTIGPGRMAVSKQVTW